MKTKLRTASSYGRNCISFTAYIKASKKHGIPRSVQKTWKVYCDLAESDKDMREMFQKQAKRWQLKVMTQLFGDKAPEVMQQEMENSNNETTETNESNRQHSEDKPGAGREDARDSG